MTSRKLFFNLLREDFRRRAWSFFLGCFVCFLCLPAAYLLLYGSGSPDAKHAVETARQLFSFENPLAVLITVTAACICAPGGFAYLHRRSTTDYYHSLPIRRELLFFVKYLNGILIYALSFGICLLLTLPLIASKGGLTAEVLTDMYMMYVIHMTAYLVLYSVALTAAFLTGNLLVNIMLIAAFYLYGIVARFLRLSLMDTFFDTFYMDQWPLGNTATVLSPLAYYIHLLENPQNLFLGWAIAILFSLLALLLYRLRPSEAADKTLAFPVTQLPIKLLIGVPSSLLGGLFFYSMRHDIAWYCFGAVAFWLIACVFLEMLFAQSFRQGLAHPKSSAACLCIAGLITLILSLDLAGYNTYVPAKDSLSYMAVDIQGLDYRSDTYTWDAVDYLSYTSRPDYRLKQMQITDLDAAYALAQEGARMAGEGQQGDSAIIVRYRTEGGRDIYRQYPILLDAQEELLAKVYASAQYKEGCYPILTDSEHLANYSGVCFYNFLGQGQSLDLDAEEIESLYAAFTADLLETSLEDTCTQAVGTLYFQISIGTMYSSDVGGYPVYADYSRTLPILEDLGIDISLDPGTVSSISIYQYRPGEPDSESFFFSDPEEIAAILPCLRDSELCWHAAAVPPDYDTDCSAELTLGGSDSPGGDTLYKSYYIYLPQAPSFLTQQLYGV